MIKPEGLTVTEESEELTVTLKDINKTVKYFFDSYNPPNQILLLLF